MRRNRGQLAVAETDDRSLKAKAQRRRRRNELATSRRSARMPPNVLPRRNPARGRGKGRPGRGSNDEIVAGRNQVVEALGADIPAISLHVQRSIDSDPRIREGNAQGARTGIPIKEHGRDDLQRSY